MAALDPSQSPVWDLRCLLCGDLAGQVVNAAFVHNPNCPLPAGIQAGHPRCCRCGGGLLKEPGSGPQFKVVPQAPRALQKRKFNGG